jgi:hypothetical protein
MMESNKLPQPYEKFESTIEDIISGAKQVRYLGGGSESSVYEAEVDDQIYAAKFALKLTRLDRPRNTVAATQRKIDAGLRGLDIPSLEQIQSASTERGVAIYELVDGVTINSMDESDLKSITESQIASFFETVDAAVEMGIEFDPWNQDGSNLMYSSESGFTLIDYFVDYAQTTKDENRLNGYRALGYQALKLAKIFGTENFDFRDDWAGSRVNLNNRQR